VQAKARWRDSIGTCWPSRGVAYLILFEGVNDLGQSFGPADTPFAKLVPATAMDHVTAAQMIAGYRQIIERAHQKGIKVLGATIAPYDGAMYYSADGEAARQTINTWIRTSGAFDGVLDFAAALSDPAKPTQIRDGLHFGDHLHGSDAGYRVLADSIDLSLFR